MSKKEKIAIISVISGVLGGLILYLLVEHTLIGKVILGGILLGALIRCLWWLLMKILK